MNLGGNTGFGAFLEKLLQSIQGGQPDPNKPQQPQGQDGLQWLMGLSQQQGPNASQQMVNSMMQQPPPMRRLRRFGGF